MLAKTIGCAGRKEGTKMNKPRTFDESYQAIRAAGGDAWDNLDVEQELAAMRGQPQGIEALVCDDITERQALGIAKYGKTVAENPLCLLEWLEHAYQECLDQAVYLRRAMAEIDKIMKASAATTEHTKEAK
jgi:hypothetical protein